MKFEEWLPYNYLQYGRKTLARMAWDASGSNLAEKKTENAELREKVRHQENLIFALEEEKEYAEIARRDFEREIYKQCDIEDALRAAVEKPE